MCHVKRRLLQRRKGLWETADGADSLVKKKIRLGSSGGVVMRTVQERGHNGGEGDKQLLFMFMKIIPHVPLWTQMGWDVFPT